MLKIIGIVVAFIVAFFIFRKIQAPKLGTERLAITVWSAFGPYDTAEDAEAGLKRACHAVFGHDRMADHENWIQGHVKNFHYWQAEQRFQKAQKLMRSGLALTCYGAAFDQACQIIKKEALEEAQKILNNLSKDLPEINEVAQRTIDYHRNQFEQNKYK